MPNLQPKSIPESFFANCPEPRGPGRPRGTYDERALPAALVTSNGWQPQKAMFWYDSIIDDMFAYPGTTYKETAARLGKSPGTIGMIVRSDLFKARYAQRRDQFNEDLDHRLIGKLAKVAELSLDLSLEKMEKTRTAIPLPLLHEITTSSLEKLGYGAATKNPSVQVNVQNNNANVAAPVSASALESARATLRTIEQSRVATPLPRADFDTSVSSRSDPRAGDLLAESPALGAVTRSVVATREGEESEGAL